MLLKMDQFSWFENTRFEDVDGKKESKSDPELGKILGIAEMVSS